MATWIEKDVLVIRLPDIERGKEFFEAFGLEFIQEQHKKGPLHYACVADKGQVLEIYPG